MKVKLLNQLDFSTLLFDTLYGLILFYSFDSLIQIKDTTIFIFYIFSTIILIHWWLIFKSSDDMFDEEVTDSAVDIVFGIIYVLVLYYLIQYSLTADFRNSTFYVIEIFFVDLVWGLVWRFIGKWRTTSKEKIKCMETELNRGILLDICFIVYFVILFACRNYLSNIIYIISYILLYTSFIALTFKYKILDIDIF